MGVLLLYAGLASPPTGGPFCRGAPWSAGCGSRRSASGPNGPP